MTPFSTLLKNIDLRSGNFLVAALFLMIYKAGQHMTWNFILSLIFSSLTLFIYASLAVSLAQSISLHTSYYYTVKNIFQIVTPVIKNIRSEEI